MALAFIYALESFLLMLTIKKSVDAKFNTLFFIGCGILFCCLGVLNDIYSYLLSLILLTSYITYSKRQFHFFNIFLPAIICLYKRGTWLLAAQFCTMLEINVPLFSQLIALYFLSAGCFIIIYKYSHATMRKYYVYMPFLYVCLLMILTLLPSVFGYNSTKGMIHLLIIEVMLLFICGLTLFYLINKQMNENKLISNQLAQEKLQKNMYNITQRLMNQISSDKHMMIYTLMKINQMVSSNANHELKDFLKEEINKYTTYKQITSTGNPLFDYEMTSKINLISSRQIEVKTFMSINDRNPILQEESVVYYLLSCIDQMIGFDVPISEIQFFFNEVNTSYLKVRIVLIYTKESENHVELDKHPLLIKHQQIHNDDYDEFIFLFHTRN